MPLKPNNILDCLVPWGEASSSGTGLASFNTRNIPKNAVLRITVLAAPARIVWMSTDGTAKITDVTADSTAINTTFESVPVAQISGLAAGQPIQLNEIGGGGGLVRGVILPWTTYNAITANTDQAIKSGAGKILVRPVGSWATLDNTWDVFDLLPNDTAGIGLYLATGAHVDVQAPSWAKYIGFIRVGGTDTNIEVTQIATAPESLPGSF